MRCCRPAQIRMKAARGIVAGFEAIRIYYLLQQDTIHVIRILHGKRDVKRILESENPSAERW